MSKIFRLAASIMAAVIVAAFVLSLFFVIHEADHDCTGEDCPICARIEACINTAKNFINFAAAALILFLIPCLLIHTSFSPLKIFGKEKTPVFLKVKLLN